MKLQHVLKWLCNRGTGCMQCLHYIRRQNLENIYRPISHYLCGAGKGPFSRESPQMWLGAGVLNCWLTNALWEQKCNTVHISYYNNVRMYVHKKNYHAVLVPQQAWIPPTSTWFTTYTTCHIPALLSLNPQPTTNNLLYQTSEGTPIGRHPPCHEQQGPACSPPLQASPRQHVLLELPIRPCWIRDYQCYGAAIPFWGPDIGSYQHGPLLQHSAGHSVLSTKRERKHETPDKQLCMCKEWQ